MSKRACQTALCGWAGIVCPECLLARGVGGVDHEPADASHVSPEVSNTLAWIRGEAGATPPAGCQWGPPQRYGPGDLAPLTPAEVAAADTGPSEADWSELFDESVELEKRREQLEHEQTFLADSWIRLQADRETLDAERLAVAAERAQVRRRGELVLAAGALLLLCGACRLPEFAAVVLTLATLCALAWRWGGRRWVEGGPR